MTDTERLDWIEKTKPFIAHHHAICHPGAYYWYCLIGSGKNTFKGNSVREAIDNTVAAEYPEPFNQEHVSVVKEDLDKLKDRVSQLESSLAELQRVVQVKDEALLAMVNQETHTVKEAADAIKEFYRGIGIKALKTTPKNLPKLIPEEEYLRVKQELVDLSRSHTVTALGKCIEKFELLKSHAEAMADSLYDYVDSDHILQSYRKDFPK